MSAHVDGGTRQDGGTSEPRTPISVSGNLHHLKQIIKHVSHLSPLSPKRPLSQCAILYQPIVRFPTCFIVLYYIVFLGTQIEKVIIAQCNIVKLNFNTISFGLKQ